jgi:phosphatidyl-myo-inositol alpha-mannosyltransferase
MRVGIVCPYDMDAPGGVQQLAGELAARLERAGDEVILVGAGRSDTGPGTVRVGRTVGVRANRSLVPVSLSPMVFPRMRRALRQVDVVHVHEPLIPFVGWAALGSRPLVVTFHASPPEWVPKMYRAAPVARLMRRSVVTAVSPTAAAPIPAKWGPVEIVPNAIDVESYRVPVPRNPLRVAFLGRDDPRKGLDVLLDAWPAIRGAVPGAELKVMGASRPVAMDGVEFKGRVGGPEKREVLASSRVFVAPNLGGESFGIVVAEGMAAGCAVVCSDLPAFRDVAGDAGTYVAVGEGNALARAVISILADPAEGERLGGAAVDRVTRFDWGVIATRYQLMYRRALGEAPARQ